MTLVKIVLLASLITFLFSPYYKTGGPGDNRFISAGPVLGKTLQEVKGRMGLPHSEGVCNVGATIDGAYVSIPGREWKYQAWSDEGDGYELSLCSIFERIVNEQAMSSLTEDGKLFIQVRDVTDEQLIQKLLSEKSGKPERFAPKNELAI